MSWDFEKKGTEESINDEVKMIGTIGEYAFRWIEESALSKRWGEGKINTLGLSPYLVEELRVKGLLKSEQVCYLGETALDYNKIGKKYQQFYNEEDFL